MDRAPLAGVLFPAAAQAWLKNHAKYVKPRTVKDYRQYIATLEKFFGALQLKEIDVATLMAYQDFRAQFAGNQRINIELSTMQQILKEAGLWAVLAPLYRPLPIDRRGSGRSIVPADEAALLDFGFGRRRRLLPHILRIMFKTGCGFGELSHVKRQDVDMNAKTMDIIEGAKNWERQRQIPLLGQAAESMQWLLDRWQALGGDGQTEYILPFQSRRKNGHIDFRRPMGSIKRAWGLLKKEIAAKDPELYERIKDFRLYDCRVTAITRALGSGKMSVHTAKKIFGHSKAMQDRYYKPDQDFLRKQMEDAMGDNVLKTGSK